VLARQRKISGVWQEQPQELQSGLHYNSSDTDTDTDGGDGGDSIPRCNGPVPPVQNDAGARGYRICETS